MSTTRATLLHRVRDPADRQAWERFFELYAPLLESYARSLGVAPSDAEEIRDQCLAVVVARMPDFEYREQRGSFKSWLKTIVHGKVVDWLRRPAARQVETQTWLELPDPDDCAERWERAWRAEHLRFALSKALEGEDQAARELAELLLDDSLGTAEISRRTGLEAAQIYKARSRLLAKVRAVLIRLGES